MKVFCGFGFIQNNLEKEGTPFYVVASSIKDAVSLMKEKSLELEISSIDSFDYIPVITKNVISIDNLAFIIRTRTDVFAKFMYDIEKVDQVFRAFFVVASAITEAIDQLEQFLKVNELDKDLTITGIDQVGSDYRIFVQQ